jgi:hypothetical protein
MKPDISRRLFARYRHRALCTGNYDDPDPLVTAENDYILKDFHFVDGESLPLSTRHNFVHFLTVGAMLRGWARSASGDTAEGIPWIEQGIKRLTIRLSAIEKCPKGGDSLEIRRSTVS